METANRSAKTLQEQILRAHDSHQYLFFLLIDIYQWSGQRIPWNGLSQEERDLWFSKWNAIVGLGRELHNQVISIGEGLT